MNEFSQKKKDAVNPSRNIALVSSPINKVKFFSFINWSYFGLLEFRKSPLKFMLISAVFLILFTIVFLLSSLYQGTFIYASSITFLLSLMFPTGFASLVIAYREYDEVGKIEALKTFRKLITGHSLRLIIVYVLLLMLVSLGSGYLAFIFPASQKIADYTMEVILVFLQTLILIAIPVNLLIDRNLEPFHAMWFSAKALFINLIPCMLFMLSVFLILVILIMLAKFAGLWLGKIALLFYLFELWAFVIWLCLAAVGMTKSLFISISE